MNDTAPLLPVRFFEITALAAQRELDTDELAEINLFAAEHPSLDGLLGLRYLAAGPHGVQLSLTVTAAHTQPWGITNGGVYCALGETAGSMAGYLAAGARKAVMGTSNETHFSDPAARVT